MVQIKKSRKVRVKISQGPTSWRRVGKNQHEQRWERRKEPGALAPWKDPGADLISGSFGDETVLKGSSERKSLMPKKGILCLMRQTVVISRFDDV